MEWWIWITGGLGLLVLELFAPMGFYLFIIGLACIIVGVLAVIGLVTEPQTQLVFASAIGILLMLLARKPLACALSALGKSSGSDITAQKVEVVENIAPGETGRGELSGATWNVRNDTRETLVVGKAYHAKRTEGLTLIVTDL